MSDDTVFAGLMRRIRASDEQVARELAYLRGEDLDWAEIAARVGLTAQARRMQLARGPSCRA